VVVVVSRSEVEVRGGVVGGAAEGGGSPIEVEVVGGAVTGIVLVGTVRCVVGVVVDTGLRRVVVVVGMVVVAGRVVVVGFGCRPSTKVETSSANTTRLTLNLYRSVIRSPGEAQSRSLDRRWFPAVVHGAQASVARSRAPLVRSAARRSGR
jgi:hypothetical protein